MTRTTIRPAARKDGETAALEAAEARASAIAKIDARPVTPLDTPGHAIQRTLQENA